jgi:Ca2+-binding EF-hand superfamily protein
LPKGLPDWFMEKVDGDGQVTMAEFTTAWTPEKLAEFNRYDLNHDGIITAEECLKVEKAKAGQK